MRTVKCAGRKQPAAAWKIRRLPVPVILKACHDFPRSSWRASKKKKVIRIFRRPAGARKSTRFFVKQVSFLFNIVSVIKITVLDQVSRREIVHHRDC